MGLKTINHIKDIFNFLKSQVSNLGYSFWNKKTLYFTDDIYRTYGVADISFSKITC